MNDPIIENALDENIFNELKSKLPESYVAGQPVGPDQSKRVKYHVLQEALLCWGSLLFLNLFYLFRLFLFLDCFFSFLDHIVEFFAIVIVGLTLIIGVH